MFFDVDVLIVGAGVAGLYCALNIRDDKKILIISKSSLTESNSYLAQGGISTAINNEDIPLFIEDTLKAGRYKNNIDSVRILAEESIDIVQNIKKLGMNFDMCNGELAFTREGAHSINRIVHCKDQTGKALIDTLISQVKKRKNITIFENSYLVDLLTKDNKCCGGIIIKDNTQININSKVVVLATGGIGGIFKNSTNQRSLTGDGIFIALKNNLQLENIDYIQFHPTAFYTDNPDSRRFLISESVRGEGGKILNIKGERFLNELSPRDVVTKEIYKEIKSSGIPYVYLDVTDMDKEYLINRFPTIYKECLKNGIDISKDYIPVSPAQHYFMGGIKTDFNSLTSMDNLFAVGEVSCTGVHGANRLASNSLLEGLVFSKRASSFINNKIATINITSTEVPVLTKAVNEIRKQNKKLLVQEFVRRTGLNYELFNN